MCETLCGFTWKILMKNHLYIATLLENLFRLYGRGWGEVFHSFIKNDICFQQLFNLLHQTIYAHIPKPNCMKCRSTLFCLLIISCLSLAATTDKGILSKAPTSSEAPSAAPVAANAETAHKLNFFERLLVKKAMKQLRKTGVDEADAMAKSSLGFGIAAVSLLFLGLLVPYVILLSIPAGIVAMVQGRKAERNGTSLTGKASTGRALGLGALIAFAALIVIAVIVVAAWAG